jgi:hypothetical protein
MRIDYGGAVIPWYEAPMAGGVNFTWQEKPAAPPLAEVQQYIANEQYQQMKMREGNGFLNNFLGNLEPIKIAAMAAATISGNAYLIPYIAGADTAIKGGNIEDVIKSAATAYVGQELGTAIGGAEGFTGASETGLATLASEGIASDVIGATLLNEVGTTGLESATNLIPTSIDQSLVTPDVLTADDLYTGQAMTDLSASYDAAALNDIINSLSNTGLTPTEIDQLTTLAPETGTELGAYTTPIEAPVIGQPYDVSPLIDPTEYGGTGQPFGEIERPLVDNYMDGFTSTSETGLATLPEEGMMPDLPGTTLLGDLGLAGAVETPIPSSGLSVKQLLTGANLAKGLLGAGQESAAAPATQFRGTRLPQGEVDYSGILGLLQMQSPQRRSLLG